MEVTDFGEVLKILETSLFQTKWRLKSASKRRLDTDVLALCMGMRPVIMVDYGGKMPELQDRLCALLKLCQKHLRVMVIEDMIYLIHIGGLRELVKASVNSETELLFVDLEDDPPKMITQADKSSVAMQLVSVQKMFSLVFPAVGMNSELSASQSSEFIDLSSCMQETQVTIPTLNGWLLGYPVVYLFGKEHIADAIYNLSTKSLHLFKVLVCRNDALNKGFQQEELMSFSVPLELSMEGSNEPWAEAFLARLQARWERCKQVWGSLKMEVSGCYPQAIVL